MKILNSMVQQIKGSANAARAENHEIVIDRALPSVSVIMSDDQEYFFQEHEAQSLLDEATSLLESLGDDADVDIEDILLHQAQSW